MNWPREIASRIRDELRELVAKHGDKKEVARSCGVSPALLNHYEKEFRFSPKSIRFLKSFANLTDHSVDYYLFGAQNSLTIPGKSGKEIDTSFREEIRVMFLASLKLLIPAALERIENPPQMYLPNVFPFNSMASSREIASALVDQPTGMAPLIAEKDIIWIDLNDTEALEGFVYVAYWENTLKIRYAKKTVINNDEIIRLHPIESAYLDDVIVLSSVAKNPILGKVVLVARRI